MYWQAHLLDLTQLLEFRMSKPRQDQRCPEFEQIKNKPAQSNDSYPRSNADNASARTLRIRALNDRLRREALGGMIMVTPGVFALGDETIRAILMAVRDFDDFKPDNDPYGEHDFGSVRVGDLTIFWKIDAYERSLTLASPDPTDPRVTRRVMTIMLADEY
jgi:hypothetical protein